MLECLSRRQETTGASEKDKMNHYTLLVGMQIAPTTMKNNMKGPQKIKNRHAMKSRYSNSGYIPKEY